MSSRVATQISALRSRLDDEMARDGVEMSGDGTRLIDSLEPLSVFARGRVPDPRLSDIVVSLCGGDDSAVLSSPNALPMLHQALPGVSVLLASTQQEVQQVTRQQLDTVGGQLKLNADGTAHPPCAAEFKASYLVNRVCCDARERHLWSRLLGDTIIFETAFEMCRRGATRGYGSALCGLL